MQLSENVSRPWLEIRSFGFNYKCSSQWAVCTISQLTEYSLKQPFSKEIWYVIWSCYVELFCLFWHAVSNKLLFFLTNWLFQWIVCSMGCRPDSSILEEHCQLKLKVLGWNPHLDMFLLCWENMHIIYLPIS